MEAIPRVEYQEAFVIGDIHGMLDQLEQILEYWNPETQQLIFVGDYIDRGSESLAVIQRVRELQMTYDAICLRGNHEELLLDFLQRPLIGWPLYERNGGVGTVLNLLERQNEHIGFGSSMRLASEIKQKHPWLVEWLRSLPYFVEFGQFICVHAGIDLEQENWRQTSLHDFVWIREAFHEGENHTGKQIIFGHTPVMYLHQQPSAMHVWHEDGKWGIDGGAVYNGSLLALQIDQKNVLNKYQVT